MKLCIKTNATSRIIIEAPHYLALFSYCFSLPYLRKFFSQYISGRKVFSPVWWLICMTMNDPERCDLGEHDMSFVLKARGAVCGGSRLSIRKRIANCEAWWVLDQGGWSTRARSSLWIGRKSGNWEGHGEGAWQISWNRFEFVPLNYGVQC